jgi:hypothetical protein
MVSVEELGTLCGRSWRLMRKVLLADKGVGTSTRLRSVARMWAMNIYMKNLSTKRF